MTGTGTIRVRGDLPPCSVSVPAVLREILQELDALIAQRHAVIEIARTAEAPVARGSEQAIKQIVRQILRNAVEATPLGGIVRVTQHERDGQVILEITDDGCGIPATDFSKIFRRGFTTKASCKGQGLAEVECRLAELHGMICWESPLRSGHGTCFTVKLPAAHAQA
jgi:signal transduction histidine kinase